jgi:hypothetical protein
MRAADLVVIDAKKENGSKSADEENARGSGLVSRSLKEIIHTIHVFTTKTSPRVVRRAIDASAIFHLASSLLLPLCTLHYYGSERVESYVPYGLRSHVENSVFQNSVKRFEFLENVVPIKTPPTTMADGGWRSTWVNTTIQTSSWNASRSKASLDRASNSCKQLWCIEDHSFLVGRGRCIRE